MPHSNGDSVEEAAERLARAIQSVILSKARATKTAGVDVQLLYSSTTDVTSALSHLLSEVTVLVPSADPFGSVKPAMSDVTRASLLIGEFAAFLVDERMPKGVRDWFSILTRKADLRQTTAFDLGLDGDADI